MIDQPDDAYATWRDAHDDEPTLQEAFTAGWDAREARNRALRDMVQQGERDGLYRNGQPSVQPPTRELITTAVRPVISRWYDTGGNLQERITDAVLALIPQPTPSEVEVEGSFFAVADLPDILARHMRALDDAHRREKQHWIEQHEQLTSSAAPTYHVECLDGCGAYSHRLQPLEWATREASRHMRDHNGHRANVAEDRDQPAEPVSIADMAPGTTFTATFRDTERRALFVKVGGKTAWPIIDIVSGALATYAADAVDPSTIRDVTPPPATPEEGDRG
jgi:hypothetical protein